MEDGLVGIGRGHAMTIERPVGRDRLALLQGQPQLAAGHDGRRHIEDDRLAIAGREGRRERIGREGRGGAAEGRQDGRAIVHRDPDQAGARRHHRIEADETGVGDVPSRHAADADRGGTVHRHLHRAASHDDARGAVALQHGEGGRVAHDANVGLGVEQAAPDHAAVTRHPGRPVGFDAAEVGLDQDFGHRLGVRAGNAAGGEQPGDQRAQAVGTDVNDLINAFGVRGHGAVL